MSRTLVLFLAGGFVLAAMGCVPSDAEIEREMSESRREAYIEWKARRARGDTKEVKVDGPLTLEDAVKLALQHNKPLQKAIEQREVTRGQRIAAYAVVLPSVTLSGGYTRTEKERGNWDIDSYSMGVRVDQPIYDGGAIPARLRQARFFTALTDEEIREMVQNVIQAVANNYYDVLLAQHLIETHREALISAEAQYRMVSEKKKQETATDYDVLRAQVDVANYRAQMISQQNAVDTNRVAMLKNMGVSQDSQITFADKLEFLPMRPVFERAVELASTNRPDLRMAEIDARVNDEAVRIARSAFWPTVSASFSQTWRNGWRTGGNPRSDSFGRNPWQADLSASYYFGIDNVGNLRAAKAEAKQAQIEILDRQEETLRQIRQEMNNLANAEEMVKALEVNQDAAREALRLVLVGYEAEVKTEVDVTDARKALTEVMGQYYTALADHTKARLNLQVAMGVLGPTCISDGPPLPPNVPIANIQEFAATDYEPPIPIPMPTADDLAPVRPRNGRIPAEEPAPEPRNDGIRPPSVGSSFEQETPSAWSAPVPASEPLPEPVTAMAPAPVAVPRTSAVPQLVLPSSPVADAAPVASASPAFTPAPEPEKTEQPVFRIKVRSSGAPDQELARN